jgi:hypothetical protein
MKKKESAGSKKTENLPGYPEYPDSEDIFKKGEEEPDIDPEKIANDRKPTKKRKVKDIENPNPGKDLDVPGSELDDELEITGGEDEENNYYSLGGDDHDDLDED